jgi:putative sterol carrier protein
VRTVSDPRVVRRVAMANGRIGVSVVDDDGGRLTVVFGFGDATRRPIVPDDPDTVVEIPIATLEGILGGARSPDEALASGDVTVRGSRLLAMQLALALAPLYPKNP